MFRRHRGKSQTLEMTEKILAGGTRLKKSLTRSKRLNHVPGNRIRIGKVNEKKMREEKTTMYFIEYNALKNVTAILKSHIHAYIYACICGSACLHTEFQVYQRL